MKTTELKDDHARSMATWDRQEIMLIFAIKELANMTADLAILQDRAEQLYATINGRSINDIYHDADEARRASRIFEHSFVGFAERLREAGLEDLSSAILE